MRILQVVHDFLPEATGGTEVYTYELSRELSKKHEVMLFFGKREWQKENENLVEEGEYDNIPYTAVFTNSSEKYTTLSNQRINRQFNKIIEKFQPDIIHFQHLLGLGLDLIDVGKKYHIPMVMTTHDYFLICSFAHLINGKKNVCNNYHNPFNCINCFEIYLGYKIRKIAKCNITGIVTIVKNIIKAFLNRIISVKRYFIITNRKRRIESLFEKIDLFISPSIILQKKLVERGIPKEKIIVLDSGINLDLFKNINKNSSERVRIGFIGSLVDKKGIFVILDAFEGINNAVLNLFGTAIEATVQKINHMNENIIFHGPFNHPEINNIFKNIDVLIVPSICMENSPLIIREAFATKTPVIASDIGGLSEMIRHGENGYLFKAGDSKGLKILINNIIDQPKIINKLTKNIKKPKSMNKNAEEMEKIYNDTINNFNRI